MSDAFCNELTDPPRESLELAVDWLRKADGLIVAAGAGMGVDSGLPDFRGNEGLWRAYPALGQAGLAFSSIASPTAFRKHPRLAWGFYGHRLALYRATQPHEGFSILRRWAERMRHGAFVFTSNVDGQFQKAGFDTARVAECHGSLHVLQCMDACHDGWWPADALQPEVDTAACELISPMPVCPQCGGMARPNVLMFNDYEWQSERTDAQLRRLRAWLARVSRPVVVEVGAGTAVPTVRWFAESLKAPLIRINLRESQISTESGVGLASRALPALRSLDAHLV